MKTRVLNRRSRVVVAVLGVSLAAACGGALGGTNGGESHFLSYCDADCDGGLDCISGLCTKTCVAQDSSCGDLASNAICTDASIDSGEGSVCDVPCNTDPDCQGLGGSHVCRAGYCRTGFDVASVDGSAGGSSGGTGNSSGSASTSGASGSGGTTSSTTSSGGTSAATAGATTAGATTDGVAGATTSGVTSSTTGSGGGAACVVLFQEYPSGSVGVENPSGCGTCSCSDGEWACTEEGCELGTQVFACPEEVMSDPVSVYPVSLDGDALTLQLVHSGGCAPHDYGICYEETLDESYPVAGQLRVIHDGHGDACEAELSDQMTFDLSRYADFYKELTASQGGIIATNYGTYAFGELSCEERTMAAEAQAREAAAITVTATPATAPTCETADDCQWVSIDTSCSASCGALASARYADLFASTLSSIETHTCGDFEDVCDPIVVPPCVAPPELACENNTCVMIEP